MVSSAAEPHQPPLTLAEAGDVLRYWLAAVRLEETLNVRPRARRVKHASAVPRLDFPAAGQEYFKVPLDPALAAMLADEEVLGRSFDGELAAFFEGWLLASYRHGQEENELSHLLCFPVVHLPRGELAGLLRCGVRLRFGCDGQPFRPPTRTERARGQFPQAPNEALLASSRDADAGWPFFIDTRLLSHPLGLASEQIDDLFEALRARDEWTECDMLHLVCETLERAALRSDGDAASPPPSATEGEQQDVDELLPRLRRAMQTLLARSGTRSEVYPVGIVIDGTQSKTTFHLQRELNSLIEALDRPNARMPRCVSAYLTREPNTTGELAQRALFTGPPLTAHQRSAAEHFWGSTLTSVQGPPGTGKTTLILHLCAEAIVRQVDGLLDRGVMGGELMVVASGNNRAVDNVIEPLTSGDGLPLALRVGSRQVCEFTLAAQLRRTLVWLQKAQAEPSGVYAEELARALTLYASVRAQLDVQLAPRRDSLARRAAHSRLSDELAALRAATPAGRESTAPLSPKAVKALGDSIRKLRKRLNALINLCHGKPSMMQVNNVARHYEKTAAGALTVFEQAARSAGIAFDVPLPPLETPLDPKALMEVWEDGAELLIERLEEVRDRARTNDEVHRIEQRAHELQTELDLLGPPAEGPLPPAGGHDEHSRALFAAALAVRDAWAKVNAASLQVAVEQALQSAEQDRSLRQLFRNETDESTLLCRLFCVWGSTLLSLGNCLSADAGSVARVVIDEAGQCHPAYAVSALMRCRSAMVIGDVHQLAPVIGLTDDDDARLLRSNRLKTRAPRLRPFRVSGDAQVSAQSVAEQAVQTRHVLVDHFRCQPEIIAISDALCDYGLRVHTPPPSDADGPAVLAHPVSMLDLRGEQERVAGSLYNELELRETLALVERLLARGVRPADLAIITPYRGQMERLRRGLFERRIPLEFSPELADTEGPTKSSSSGLALGTVHRFQGGERSIVLFSSVVTRTSSLSFLNARPNLLNVAASRAQRHFVCLGARHVLREGKLTRILVDAARPLDE